MKKINGIVNGIDVQTILKRTQAFIVENPRQLSDVQVTSYDDGFQIRLAIASLFDTEVTVEYDEVDGEHKIHSILENGIDYRLTYAQKIAGLKKVKTEDTVVNGQLTRIRILDR